MEIGPLMEVSSCIIDLPLLIPIEFNIVADPEAAATIFSLPTLAAKTTLIPLDVSHQVLANKYIQNLLRYGKTGPFPNDTKPSVLRTMLVELLRYFAETYATVFGLTDGPPLHDPIAVAAIFEGTEYAVPLYDHEEGQEDNHERFNVTIVTDGTHAQALSGEKETGRTIATLLPSGREGVKIPRGLNVPEFWRVLEECLEKADTINGS
jgi:uridine nucleosidase